MIRAVCCAFLLAALLCRGQDRKVIRPKDFPANRGVNAGLLAENTLYVSGQTGEDWRTGQLPDEFEAEARQCLKNVQAVLQEAKMSFSDVVSVQVFLTDLTLMDRFQKTYRAFFRDSLPALTIVGAAALMKGAHVQVTVVANNGRARYMPMRTSP